MNRILKWNLFKRFIVGIAFTGLMFLAPKVNAKPREKKLDMGVLMAWSPTYFYCSVASEDYPQTPKWNALAGAGFVNYKFNRFIGVGAEIGGVFMGGADFNNNKNKSKKKTKGSKKAFLGAFEPYRNLEEIRTWFSNLSIPFKLNIYPFGKSFLSLQAGLGVDVFFRHRLHLKEKGRVEPTVTEDFAKLGGFLLLGIKNTIARGFQSGCRLHLGFTRWMRRGAFLIYDKLSYHSLQVYVAYDFARLLETRSTEH